MGDAVGFEDGRTKAFEIPKESSLVANVFERRVTLYVRDPSAGSSELDLTFGESDQRYMRSSLTIPIRFRGSPCLLIFGLKGGERSGMDLIRSVAAAEGSSQEPDTSDTDVPQV